jgi:transposase
VSLEGLKRACEERKQYWLDVRDEYFELREDFGMSKNEAAKRIGIHEATARRYEREKRNSGILAQDA